MAKHYYELSPEKIAARVRSMVSLRAGIIETGVDGYTVRFSTSNRKTGASVPSVSLIPVADCGNCKVCAGGCYDVRNVVVIHQKNGLFFHGFSLPRSVALSVSRAFSAGTLAATS